MSPPVTSTSGGTGADLGAPQASVPRNQRGGGGGGGGKKRRARSSRYAGGRGRGSSHNNRQNNAGHACEPAQPALVSAGNAEEEAVPATNATLGAHEESATLLGLAHGQATSSCAQPATRTSHTPTTCRPSGTKECDPRSPHQTRDDAERELRRPLLLIPEEGRTTPTSDSDTKPQVAAQHRQPPTAGSNFKPAKPQAPMSMLERKWSQCSGSQASASSSALGTSRRSSTSCLGLDRASESSAAGRKYLRQAYDKLTRKSSSRSTVDLCSFSAASAHEAEAGLGLGLGGELRASALEHRKFGEDARRLSASRRTISQSMLALDQEARHADFRVYWRDLTFAYERPLLARTLAKVAPRLGLGAEASAPGQDISADQGGARSRGQLVLHGLSGGFRSNELVAIIGPSGCGKTTLLQFLAGNNSGQRQRMRIAGLAEPKVAYIGQDDALLPGLTARETLVFASRLQNTRANFDHLAHIQPVLAELGLSECADRSVSKLSGGQAKRVTIAQELLYPTNLLILDEVTSGLDASTSYSIVRLLKHLVSDRTYPMSIVMSIHQPSARLFSVFDRVYAMTEGQCLYEGACEPAAINARLARFQLECPKFHNIADYLIELACCCASGAPDGQGDEDTAKSAVPPAHQVREQMIEYQRKLSLAGLADEKTARATNGMTTLNELHLFGEPKTNGGDEPAPPPPPPPPPPLHDDDHPAPDQSLYLAIERARKQRPRPMSEHFKIHFRRSLVRIRRSYILTYLQLVTYILLGLQLATFYGPTIGELSGCPRLPSNLMNYVLTSGPDGISEDDLTLEMRRIQENMNFLLVTVMTATFAALEITVITFPLEAKTIKREWRNGWYRVSSYFLGRTLADLPFQLAFVLVFCLLIYVMTGQLGLASWRFGAFVATIVMTALVAQSFGFIFGALFMDNLPAAVFTAPLAIFPALLFSGFFSRVSQIPAFYKPMTYLSHFRYAFDALLVTLYGHDRCACDQAALDTYHANLHNQTSSMREMFGLLFGASDCLGAAASAGAQGPHSESGLLTTTAGPSPAPLLAPGAHEISHEDLAAIRASNATLAAHMLQAMAASRAALAAAGTPRPSIASPAHSGAFKPLEDALIESMFDQMTPALSQSGGGSTELLNETTTGGAGEPPSVVDRLADRFSGRLTSMLNKQSNFGHEVPRHCDQFNSYLMTEFDLRNEDLIFGLAMLLLVLLATRLLCNCILNFTIATRAK